MTFCVLGVGNTLHSDDGAGPATIVAVRELCPDIPVYNCGTAPENFIGPARKLHPDLLLIVDAADMGLLPGSVRRIPEQRIHDTAIGTHMMALSHLMRFLADAAEEILVIGIQPATLVEGEELSPEVEDAVAQVAAAIAAGTVRALTLLE